MWPFSKDTEDLPSKAEAVAPLLVKLYKDTSPTFLESLVGSDVSPNNEGLLDSLVLETLAFSLHLTDRLMFAHLDAGQRALFMDSLFSAIKRQLQPPHDAYLVNLSNERQQFYGSFRKLIAGENETLKDTFFWEFGKAMAASYSNDNPPAATYMTVAGIELLKAMTNSCVRQMSSEDKVPPLTQDVRVQNVTVTKKEPITCGTLVTI